MFEHKHPLYVLSLADWQLMQHVFAGERAVKDEGDTYLPPTAGMRAKGYGRSTRVGNNAPGQAAYEAYKMRAVFHSFTRDAAAGLLGIMHRKPPQIEVPARLEPMLERFSSAGESVDMVWRRISQAQLTEGRLGLLVDVPSDVPASEAIPYVALYAAPTVINWNTRQDATGRYETSMVVLDESASVMRDDLQWEWKRRYRVLAMGDVATAMNGQGEDGAELPEGVYCVAVVEGDNEVPIFGTPLIGEPLEAIPFVFVNPNDVVPEPDKPPLLALANLDLAIYRGEADYRQHLYLCAQDTLVRVGYRPRPGEDPDAHIGAGEVIDLPFQGDARFIGVTGSGLGEQRQALENDKAQAAQKAIQLLDTGRDAAESGEALRVRVSARTANLASILRTGAQAIRDCLVHAGRFMGISEAELEGIVVEPNLDFSDARVDANSVNAMMDAISKGAPLSLESFHQWLVDNEYTSKSFDEEMQAMGSSPVSVAVPGEAPPEVDEEGNPMPADGTKVEADEAVDPDTAFNGAQVQAMVELAKSVAAGELPAESAIQILFASYPIDMATARAIIMPADKHEPPKPDPVVMPAGFGRGPQPPKPPNAPQAETPEE